MDPFLSDRHARWHPVDLSLFPLRPSPLRPPIITRSLTLARCAKTPVRTEAQDRTTPPARRAPVEALGLAELGLRVLRRSEVRERVRGWC